MSRVIRITIGDEYDEALKGRIFNVLADDGATVVDSFWGVGGSQEIERKIIRLQGDYIVIESETYIGLTIEGPEHLVCGLIERLKNSGFPPVIQNQNK